MTRKGNIFRLGNRIKQDGGFRPHVADVKQQLQKTKTGDYGINPGYYGINPGYYGINPGYYGINPGYYGINPGYYGINPGDYGINPGYYGICKGNYIYYYFNLLVSN